MSHRQQRRPPPATLRVRDLRRLLASTRRLLESRVGNRDSLVSYLRELDALLGPYEYQEARTLLEALRSTLSSMPVQPSLLTRALPDIDDKTPLDDIKRLVEDDSLTREQLRAIAERRFGLPPGNLSRLTAARVREEIKSAIENEETYGTIARLASRREYPRDMR